ncbi:hypothetical protein [Pseudomonas sp. 24 E 13]|uniref:hypothetical protein n=1 Tax=Pseudomonas sp. 24 E 13 TaxID=1844095 RepID=UPI00081264CC|nr:hypothetical protein [Pseudomonas sp. 24 E 13]CRM76008.1 hypothetical protein [Pseudomonas sp. 24 E 13]
MKDVNGDLPSGEHIIQLLGRVAGGAGILTFMSFLAGGAKLFVLYYFLECIWVLGLHGFNDFVFEGMSTVAVFSSAAAIAYCISPDHKKILINVSNRLWLLMWLVFFILMYVGVSKKTFSQYAYFYFFASAGVNLAGFLSWSMSRREAVVYALLSFIGFALGTLFVSFLSLYSSKGFYDAEIVVLSNSKAKSSGILINSFNGKHLLKVCGPGVRFMVIEPSDDWISQTPGSNCDLESSYLSQDSI